MDLVVAGSGLAGLTAALTAARLGAHVSLITAGDLLSGSSPLAQGGVAAAVGEDDSPALHAADTLRVGGGLNDAPAVQVLVEQGRDAVLTLLAEGAPFDRLNQQPELMLEAGHSRRRVLHGGGGATGRVLTEWRLGQVLEHPAITLHGGCPATEIILENGRAAGLRCGSPTGGRTFAADAVILATGGYAALWPRTTNSGGNDGSGLVMAWRAGAALADLELVQFHPTALELPGQRAYLLSEALRGEGAQVVDARGQTIADPLLPRDVLARVIARWRAEHGPVYLSLRHLEPGPIRRRFASLAAELASYGLDLTGDLVPISPAAHYCMGGIRTDSSGRTSVPGLYAAGEAACTGVQGANRLASNSLLECLVFGQRAAQAALSDGQDASASWALGCLPGDPGLPQAAGRGEGLDLGPLLLEHCAVEREEAGLLALSRLVGQPEDSVYPLAAMILRGALVRRESRGAHYRSDFPGLRAEWRGRIHWRYGQPPAFETAG